MFVTVARVERSGYMYEEKWGDAIKEGVLKGIY